jgi:hypothetical protein
LLLLLAGEEGAGAIDERLAAPMEVYGDEGLEEGALVVDLVGEREEEELKGGSTCMFEKVLGPRLAQMSAHQGL